MSLHRHAAKRDTVERSCISAAESMGAAVFCVSGAGLLDLLVAHDGALLPVEVKEPGEPLTTAQAETLQRLWGVDVSAWVVESPEDMRALLSGTLPRWTPGARAVEGEKKRTHRPGRDKARSVVEACVEPHCVTSRAPGGTRCAKHNTL